MSLFQITSLSEVRHKILDGYLPLGKEGRWEKRKNDYSPKDKVLNNLAIRWLEIIINALLNLT